MPDPEKILLNQWGFKSRKDYEGFIREQLRGLDIQALELKSSFDHAVEHWVEEYLAGQNDRFVARIESPPPSRDGVGESNLLKRPARIAEIILKSWGEVLGENQKDSPITRHDPRKFLLTIPDIVRFRIVCNYLKDLRFIDEKLKAFIESDQRLQFKGREDHIHRHYAGSRVGHRAVEYTIRFKKGGTSFLFEVQIMTQLQHTWDKKDHHLVYEHVRAGKGDLIPVDLKNRVTAMSELFYVADLIFDGLLEEITQIMKKSSP